MTVEELRQALVGVDGGYEIKISGDSSVMGDGCTMTEPHIAPGLQNVAQQDGFLVLWPECSWGEAMEHADSRGDGVE